MINMIMLIIYKEFILYLSLILLVDPLTLTFIFIIVIFTLILHLKVLFNSPPPPPPPPSSLLLLFLLLLFIIYIVHLPVV